MRVKRHAGFIDARFLTRTARSRADIAAQHVNAAACVDWLRQFGMDSISLSRLQCAYWYDTVPREGGRDDGADLDFLRSIGRIPKVTLRLGGGTKLGADVALAVDLVLLAARDAIETAVVIGGDAHLVPAVARARAEGVRVIVAYPREASDSISVDLLAAADDHVQIDEDTTRQLFVPKR